MAREQALEWTREVRMESDEERERKSSKKKKPKADIISGDEAEPKVQKKRRGKLKKATSDQGDVEQAVFSEEEEVEKPAKKVCVCLPGRSAKVVLILDDYFSGLPKSGLCVTRRKMRMLRVPKSNCKLFGWTTRTENADILYFYSKSKAMLSDTDDEMS